MPIAAVIFDLDDTLMPEHPADYAAMDATADALPDGAAISPVNFRQAILDAASANWQGTSEQAFARVVGTSSLELLWYPDDRSTPGLTLLSEFAPRFRENVWRLVAQAAGADPYATWQSLDSRYRAERDVRHIPYDDVVPVLGGLQGKYRLGLLTNGAPKVQRHKAEAAGLLVYFDEVLVSGDVEMQKPDVRLFEILLDRLGATPDTAVLVGDRPATDIAGANAAGIRSIQIHRPDNTHATDGPTQSGGAVPDAIITSLDELHQHLE